MITQLKTEQAILTGVAYPGYSDVFQRGPILPVKVKVRLREETQNAASVIYIETSDDNVTYRYAVKFELSKNDSFGSFTIPKYGLYLRAYVASISGCKADIIFDAVEE